MRARSAVFFIAATAAAISSTLLRAEELVVTLSTREVAITSTYTGADITIFGLIERDARTIARSGNYDIVATVQGPSGEIAIQRKEKFGPIWLTDSRRRYGKVPLFFSTLSAKPVSEIGDETIRARLKLGLEYFLAEPRTSDVEGGDFAFRDALIRLRQEEGALTHDHKAITMIRPNLFSARVALPAKAPTGLYIVNVSVLSEGVPLKTVQAGFVVRKVGFDAFVANAARFNPTAYAILTVIMAILLGWLANIVFRKD